jgi:zinc protease
MRLRTILLLAVFVAVSAYGQTEKVTSVEGITEYRLANGLKVLLFPDPSKETATVNMTYLVGSRHEGYGESGMAHLLEHLIFKGTPKHPNIPKELTDHGTRPNGSTSFDRTNYFESFQATDTNLEWALDLEADRMVNSYIAKKDLDSEMTVVRNEFESRENSPFNVLFEKALATAYQWHGYGRTTIGARSDLENVPIERLQAFYRNYYQPDNAVLIVAGKFDEAKTLKLIEKDFAAIPKPARKLYPTYTVEPTQEGERSVTLRRIGDTQHVVALYHIPAGAQEDFAALDVLGNVLTDVPSGRLYKSLVETKKAASIGGGAYQLREPGVMIFTAQVRKENSVEEAKNILLKTVDEIAAKPATEEELNRAKTQYEKMVDQQLSNSERLALQLSEWEGMGDWRLFFLHRDRVRKVTLDDVKRVAARYLKPSNRTVGVFLPEEKPERAEIPAAPDVKAALKDYKGQAAVAQGEAFDTSPGNIDSRTRRGQIGDGIKLAFIEKKTRGNTVTVSLQLHFGDEKNLMDRAAVASLTGRMLMRGTTSRTRQEIEDTIDKLKAQVMVSGGLSGASASIQTTRENLPAVLKLVAELLKTPSFPEKEFDQLKLQQLSQLESQRREPQTLAMTAMGKHLNPYPKGSVHYVQDSDEQAEAIKAVTLDQVKQFYKEFYGASKAELAVVGDFDAEATQSLAKSLFADWKSGAHYAKVMRTYQPIAAINKAIEAPDKANAFFIASKRVNVSDEDPDNPALVLGTYMLGGGFLNSRLAVRIRQKDGLSYGVGAMMNGVPKERNQSFMAYAICAPQNVPKVEAAFKEELARVLKDGFTVEEIEAAKKGWLQSRQVSRGQDRELVGRLAAERFEDRTMAFDAEMDKQVQALTAEQIVEAMRRNLKVEDLTIVKAGDFKKAGVSF